MSTRSPKRSGTSRLAPLVLVATGLVVLARGTADAAPVVPAPASAPILTAAECPAGSTLVSFQIAPWSGATSPDGLYQLGIWTTASQPTGIVLPAGTINITKYWSWHPGPFATANEANQQWAIRVGSDRSEFSEDLLGTAPTALTVGSLGTFTSSGGSIDLVHSSTPGSGYPGLYDGTNNSVAPLGFCYEIPLTETTTIAGPTTASPTTANPTTVAPTTVTPTTASPTVLPTTQSPTTQAATTVAAATVPATAPDRLGPVTTATPTSAPTSAAPLVAPSQPPAVVTTVADIKVLPVIVAPETEVLGKQQVALTGTSSGATGIVGLGMSILGLVLLGLSRRRETSR
jgi:hypothetical protein